VREQPHDRDRPRGHHRAPGPEEYGHRAPDDHRQEYGYPEPPGYGGEPGYPEQPAYAGEYGPPEPDEYLAYRRHRTQDAYPDYPEPDPYREPDPRTASPAPTRTRASTTSW
jgi:hypothetical protein